MPTERTGIAGAVRRARKHERSQNMKSVCLCCRNGEPAEYVKEPVSNIGYWTHGKHHCEAGPIRDREMERDRLAEQWRNTRVKTKSERDGTHKARSLCSESENHPGSLWKG